MQDARRRQSSGGKQGPQFGVSFLLSVSKIGNGAGFAQSARMPGFVPIWPCTARHAPEYDAYSTEGANSLPDRQATAVSLTIRYTIERSRFAVQKTNLFLQFNDTRQCCAGGRAAAPGWPALSRRRRPDPRSHAGKLPSREASRARHPSVESRREMRNVCTQARRDRGLTRRGNSSPWCISDIGCARHSWMRTLLRRHCEPGRPARPHVEDKG